jgi:hypothetical protein
VLRAFAASAIECDAVAGDLRRSEREEVRRRLKGRIYTRSIRDNDEWRPDMIGRKVALRLQRDCVVWSCGYAMLKREMVVTGESLGHSASINIMSS